MLGNHQAKESGLQKIKEEKGFEKEGGELRSKGNEEVERKNDLLGCSVFCCRRRGSMQSFRPER